MNIEDWHRLPEAHFDSICCHEPGSLAHVLGVLHGASWARLLSDGASGALAGALGAGAPDASVACARTLAVAPDGRVAVTPLRAWAEDARAAGGPALLVADSAGVGPWACRPLALGADVVVEDAGSWLGVGGTLVCARTARAGEALLAAAGLPGDVGSAEGPEPDVAVRVLLATASARTQRRCDTALALAAFLEAHSAVAWVSYPGLPADPCQDAAHRTLEHGAGPLVSFGLACAAEAPGVLARAAADERLLGAPAGGLPACDATRLSAAGAPGALALRCGAETPMDVVAAVEAALAPARP